MTKLSLSEVNFTYGSWVNTFHLYIFTTFEAYLISYLYGHVIVLRLFCNGKKDLYTLCFFFSPEMATCCEINFRRSNIEIRWIIFYNPSYRRYREFKRKMRLITIFYWREFHSQQVSISGLKKKQTVFSVD
jgi:hypothetical protein